MRGASPQTRLSKETNKEICKLYKAWWEHFPLLGHIQDNLGSIFHSSVKQKTKKQVCNHQSGISHQKFKVPQINMVTES